MLQINWTNNDPWAKTYFPFLHFYNLTFLHNIPIYLYITNPSQLIILVPQPLLFSINLFLFINEWFYLYIFTQHFIIEFFFTILFLLSTHIWICDLILSLFKKHPTFYPFLFITILLFINSETLLFLTYLWIIFNYLWISKHNILLFPDPIELTFSNTILLSITTSYLCIYSLNNNDFLQHIYFYLTYFTGLFFLFLQIYEYQLLYFYISDSFYTSSFYLITGLHFSHVIIGIILLNFTFTSLYNIKLFYTNIQLFYWHFVEIIWIILYLIFYSSFGRAKPKDQN